MIKVRNSGSNIISIEALNNPRSRNGILGISLGKKYFSKENVASYMRFGLDTFNQMLIAVGDYPERWNFMAIKGMPEDEARERALFSGIEHIRRFERVKRTIKQESYDINRVEVTSLGKLMESGDIEYNKILEIMHKHYNDNIVFRDDITKWILRNIGGRFKEAGLTGSKLEKALDTSSNYLKEEIALFTYLAERDPRKFIDIYPSTWKEQSCTRNIYEGKYPLLAKELELKEGMGFIDARAKRPIVKVVSEKVGRLLGNSPNERRTYEKRTIELLENTRNFAYIGLAYVLLLGSFVYLDVSTRTKTIWSNGYVIIERKNGSVEINPIAGQERWYDKDGNGNIDEIRRYLGRGYEISIEKREQIAEADKIYKQIKKECEQF